LGQNSGLFPPRTQIGEAFGFLQIEVSIEVSRVQVAAAVNRALGNQHKPRTKRSLLGIEDVSPAMHKQEDILKEVVRFGSIAQNAHRNSSYQS